MTPELTITWQPNALVVAGKKAEQNGGQYLHRGIAGRSFQRQFSLADYVKVAGASLENGMLSIDLVREVRARYPEIVCVVMTAFASFENAVSAIKAKNPEPMPKNPTWG